jgi:hypothetical protein
VLVYPALMLLWIGFSWSVTLAVLDGLLNWGGRFVRTPKFRARGGVNRWQESVYRPKAGRAWIGEFALGLYVWLAVGLAVDLQHNHLLPLILVYALGEMVVLGATMSQVLAAHRARRA